MTAAALLLVLSMVQAPTLGWASAATVLPAVAGLLLLGLFLAVERRSATPLMPLELLSRPNLWGGMLITAAFMASFGMQIFFLTLYLQSALHMPPIAAGLSFLPLSAFIILGNATGGLLATRFGVRRVLAAGLSLGALGLLSYARLEPSASLSTLVLAEGIAGFGHGIAFTTAYLLAGSGIEASRQGVASAMASSAQQLGGAIGLALLVDLLSGHLQTRGMLATVLDGRPVAGLVPALHWVFVAQAAVALAAALLTAFVIGKGPASARRAIGGRATPDRATSTANPFSGGT